MAQYSGDKSRRIHYRAIAEGNLILETPAHFGTGEQTGTELIILQDASTGDPLLPGTSIAGALRGYLLSREKGYRIADEKDTITKDLFGEALDNERGNQSRIIIYDSIGKTTALGIRDGVKIDGEWRTAHDGALFSVQTWPEGTVFPLRLELIICEGDDAEALKHAFAALLGAFASAEIPLGARKNRGYGRCRVSDWEVREFKSNNLGDFLNWLTNYPAQPNTYSAFMNQHTGFMDNRRQLSLKARFALCDSLMIRSGADLVDSTHLLNADGKPVLSGTSLAGALRARALKILRTINPTDERGLIDDLFGPHGGEDRTDKSNLKASRLKISESDIEQGVFNQVQNRVKIDRFTGGAYETALISEQPVFATPQTQVSIELKLEISESMAYEEQQIGLILLLLKDLWTEDLPLGGEASIGRGRLRGLHAELSINASANKLICTFDEHGLSSVGQTGELQFYVDKLWESGS